MEAVPEIEHKTGFDVRMAGIQDSSYVTLLGGDVARLTVEDGKLRSIYTAETLS